MSEWPSRKLADIADIRVSNVDKKTNSAEKPVKLCNYMDVYSNLYITDTLDFMAASATAGEIERFRLHAGDVLITKDSETPDDIGIAAIVAQEIDNLVCGYHLALIRPNPDELDSIYLAKQLSTAQIARYFAVHAAGSTRYGLPISAIQSLDIPTPPTPEQAKIAEVLSTVDRAIEHTELLVAKQQRINTGIMQDLLTRGLDEQGQLRSERGHEFKNSMWGRIPVEWDPSTLERVGTWKSGGTPSKANSAYWGDDVPWVCPKDMKTFDLSNTTNRLTRAGVRHGGREVPANTVFIVVRGMILAHTFPVSISNAPMSFNQDVKAIIAGPNLEPRFLAYWFASNGSNLLKITTTATHGTRRFDMKELFEVPIALPKKREQGRIVERLDAAETEIAINKKSAAKLRSLKSGLMQDLLTGRKRVTSLLKAVHQSAGQAS